MRALVLHPISNYNIGDMLTYRGTQEILRAADPDVEFLMFDMWRAQREKETYMTQFYWGDVDVLVLAGSPWIWFNPEASLKYRLLTEAVKRFESIPKIALGVGACFPLDFLSVDKVYDEMLLSKQAIPAIQDTLGRFDLVVTRDPLAQGVLKRIGIEALYAKDTSWYAKGTFSRSVPSDKPLCIFQDPKYCLTKAALGKDYIERYLQAQIEYVMDREAEVYSISAEDAYTAQEFNLRGRYVADLDWVAAHMVDRPSVLSGRVHMGLLAHMMGAGHVEVLPLDSRYLTLNAFPRIDIYYLDKHYFEPEEPDLKIEELMKKVEEVLL